MFVTFFACPVGQSKKVRQTNFFFVLCPGVAPRVIFVELRSEFP